MYVSKYAEKFEVMAIYSRQIVYAPYELWKIDQFLFSLRLDITHSVSQREFTSYAKCLRQFYVVENSLNKICDEKDQNKSGYKDNGDLVSIRNSKTLHPRGSRLMVISQPSHISVISVRECIMGVACKSN